MFNFSISFLDTPKYTPKNSVLEDQLNRVPMSF